MSLSLLSLKQNKDRKEFWDKVSIKLMHQIRKTGNCDFVVEKYLLNTLS